MQDVPTQCGSPSPPVPQARDQGSSTRFREVSRRTQGFLERHEHDTTFQGHPNLNVDSAKTLLAAARAYMEVGEVQKTALAKRMESVHDGVWMWGRILFGSGNEPSSE